MILNVEIANTPRKQSKGLMFRDSLDDDNGMMFKFDRPQKLKFWNLNTFIPLDIAFVNKDNVITQISHIHPMSPKDSCNPQTVTSKNHCPIAIEANAGFFAKNNIDVGYRIEINDLNIAGTPVAQLRFKPNIKTSQQLVDKPDETDPHNSNLQELQQHIDIDESTSENLIQLQESANEYRDGLPVLDVDELASFLEDSYDEDEQGYEPPDELDVSPESQDQYPLDEPQEPFPVPDEEEYPDFSSTAEAMAYGQLEREVVRIWYQTKRGRDIEREVEPHGQFIAKTTGNHILVTFDRTVGDIRAFIMDNVLYYSFVGKDFEKKFLVKQ